MKVNYRFSFLLGLFSMPVIFSMTYRNPEAAPFRMPYRKAGLDARQAAALLLDKFTFGNRPGAVDEILRMGHEQWFLRQLEGGMTDTALDRRLAGFDALHLTNTEVLKQFPRPGAVAKEMERAGIIRADETDKTDKSTYRRSLREFMSQKGYRPQRELYRQHVSRKILAAAYSSNQLRELLADFWFNHFNVSITKNACAQYVPAYERDVIRPRVTGRFYDLLLATAQSPAMLLYLDNVTSTSDIDSSSMTRGRMNRRMNDRLSGTDGSRSDSTGQVIRKRVKSRGLNENYAREIMELHTLGVDGGYTQQDVTQAAKILTGWTIYPQYKGGVIRRLVDRVGEERLTQQGFVHKGDFLFAAPLHDKKEKTLLGKTFPAGGGFEEGVQLLQLLAEHPATARFISRKLAVRFVSDNPSPALVDKMALAFTQSGGDIAVVLKTMVSTVEFWTAAAKNQKTKSPFELAISAVRALDADIRSATDLNRWISKMGQPLYAYQAPTGYPDKGQFWINSGSIINRMNFGLTLASGKIDGVRFNLSALNHDHEPESAAAVLRVYCGLLLPGRKTGATIKRLAPLLNAPGLEQKVAAAALKKQQENTDRENGMVEAFDEESRNKGFSKESPQRPVASVEKTETTLAQVTGIIIGSPEFQRR